MKRLYGALGVAACLSIATYAYAADAVANGTSISIPYGDIVTGISQIVLSLLGSLALWGFRKLPQNIVAVFGNSRVDALIENAKNYGVNAVAGATKDKSMDLKLGNAVLVEALVYALNNAGPYLQKWAGGPEQIAAKIWAKLNLESAADAGDIPAIVQSVTAK